MPTQFDSLEARRLFHTDVSATLDRGLVFLQSDDHATVSLRITSATERGRRVVVIAGQGTTTVNGQARLVLRTSEFRQLQTDLRGPNDRLVLRGVDLPGGAEIKSSQDDYTFESTRVGAEFRYIAGGSQTGGTPDGPGTLVIRSSDFREVARLDGALAKDTVTIDRTRFRKAFTYQGNGGGDAVAVTASVFNSTRSITGAAISRSFDFGQGRQGFNALFSDFAPANGINPRSGLRTIPTSAGGGTGFFLGATNRSDDTFMFLTRKLTAADGLEANTDYTVSFVIRVASNAPSNAVGIGGPPGESVFLKAGATPTEPRVRLDRTDRHFRANFDHGAQANSGNAASVAGNIANGTELTGDQTQVPYTLLTFEHTHTATVRTDAKGNLHLVVGTDSGFEGRTELYYKSIDVSLTRV